MLPISAMDNSPHRSGANMETPRAFSLHHARSHKVADFQDLGGRKFCSPAAFSTSKAMAHDSIMILTGCSPSEITGPVVGLNIVQMHCLGSAVRWWAMENRANKSVNRHCGRSLVFGQAALHVAFLRGIWRKFSVIMGGGQVNMAPARPATKSRIDVPLFINKVSREIGHLLCRLRQAVQEFHCSLHQKRAAFGAVTGGRVPCQARTDDPYVRIKKPPPSDTNIVTEKTLLRQRKNP